MFDRIAIANDGSDGAFKALAFALDLAETSRARLHMLSVEELSDLATSIDEVIEEKAAADRRFQEVVERAEALARLKRVTMTVHVMTGHPVGKIVDYLNEHDVDLLVVGFMGHSALYERIIGGTAERLVRLAPCTVTVVK